MGQAASSLPAALPAARRVIVGTAGHIDHGKTALVKALTGIDADRLQEEKRRGITIDIGFAHLELAAASGALLRLGFVDVPGHERFVRNMLAGIGGIDLVLFVVAADEGIKPQTREHFEICRLLSVPRGITVLTKSDLVDAETLQVVRMELEEFFRGSFLDVAKSSIVPVSARTGTGIDQLKRELARAASEVPLKDSSARFRLPIDRVFTMKGFGTVITGTLISGSVRRDDEVEIFPQRERGRVRGVQVHGRSADAAFAGERTALNLAGSKVSIDDLARGMMLAQSGVFEATRRIDVSLSLLPGAKPLRHGARVHFHAYTTETVAQVALHAGKEVAPGKSAFARLRFPAPVLLLPGDRFIIRQFSPVVTIGGGVVLDAAPISARRSKQPAEAVLQALAQGDAGQVLKARVARRFEQGLTFAQAVAETGWTDAQLQSALKQPVSEGAILQAGQTLLGRAAFDEAKAKANGLLKAFHRADPLATGMNKEALREELQLSSDVFATVLQSLVAERKLEVASDNVRLSGQTVVLKDEESESKRVIEHAFHSAGLKVPALKEVLAGLKIDKARAQRIVTLLLREKVLIKLNDDLIFHSQALQQLRQMVKQQKSTAPRMDVARFKDLTGVTRKYAIPLLEYLDREHVTRRVGDERVVL